MISTTHIQIILDIECGDETSGCAVSGISRKDMLLNEERSVASSDYFGKSNARALIVIYTVADGLRFFHYEVSLRLSW